MGTRCLTFVYEMRNNKKVPLVNLYRQYDGYPSGHGAEVADFLATQGHNGMSCLAASLVAHFKESVGGFYIHPVTDTECGQDYEYHIFEAPNRSFYVEVVDRGINMFGLTTSERNEIVFKGNLAEFTKYCKEKELA